MVIIATGTIHGQDTTKTIKTKSITKSMLKTLNDSASYAIGISVANFYRQQGITELNTNMVSKAIVDVMGGKKILLNEMQANNVIMNYMNKMQEKKAKPAIEEGEKFLEENKKRGVKTTTSGLQYEVIKEGKGPIPIKTDTVICHYKGTLLNGTEFDNSYSTGEPLTIAVTRVIKGWTEVLQLMPVGSKWKVYIPYKLAYGSSDYGQIPGGSVLIFELELVGIKGK